MTNTKLALKTLHTLAALCGLLALTHPAQAYTSADAAGPVAPTQAADDDALWSTRFGPPGIADGQIETIAVAQTGDVYVGGSFEIPSVGAKSIARWDGSRWFALGTGIGSSTARINQIAIAGNTLYAAGSFKEMGGVSVGGIAQWNGTAWSAVGNGTGARLRTNFGVEDAQVEALAVAPNGDVYIGGNFNEVDDVPAMGIARWNGQSWQALGLGVGIPGFEEGTRQTRHVYAIAIASDTSIYVGGEFSLAGSNNANSIAHWDGTDWSALADGVTAGDASNTPGIVRAIALGNNQVFAGGNFKKAGAQNASHIAVWNGTDWSALGAGVAMEFDTEPPVYSLMLDGTMLVAGGAFNRAGNQASAGIARWNGSAWSAMPEMLSDLNGVVVKTLAFAQSGEFYAGGNMISAGSTDAHYLFDIGRWTGERWANLGEGVSTYSTDPADVLAVAEDDQGNVYVGGKINRAGGLKVSQVAMFDGTRWYDMAGGVSGGSSLVYTILPIGDDIYVGGNFSQAGNVAASNIARWNRVTGQWSSLGQGTDGTVYALAFGDGSLFAGGGFAQAGTVTARDVAVWNGQTWSGLGGNYEIFEIFSSGAEVGTYVQGLTYLNGQLFIAGHYQTIHEKAKSTADKSSYTVVHNIVGYRFADQGWFALGSLAEPGISNNGSSGFGVSANAITSIGNAIYVGGIFNRAGNTPAQNLARYDVGTDSWSSVGAMGGVANTDVRALAAYGTDLFVAGSFTSIGTANARYIARLDTAANTWHNLGTGLKWYNDQYTHAQAVAVSSNGVYVGGKFDKAGGIPSVGLAHWTGVIGATNLTPEQGGIVNAGDGTRVEVPAGAVTQPANLAYMALPNGTTPPPANTNLVRRLQLNTQTLNGQPINTLAKPMLLKLPYTDTQLQTAKIDGANTLTVVRWDGTAWQPLPACTGCGVDTANKLVTTQGTEMGIYALVGKTQATVPPPPPGNERLFMPMLRR